MPRIRFFRGAGGRLRLRPPYRTKEVVKNNKSRKASKNFFRELQLRKVQTTQKDRFLYLVKEQPDDIAAIHLPPSSAGKAGEVTAAALRDLPEYRLQRLFEITTAMMKHSDYIEMEPRDIAFGYSLLMLGRGL